MKQLEYANLKNKLVTIHCVYEWEKLLKLLENTQLNNLKNKIILHSFQGTKKIIEKYKRLDVWFSLSSRCYIDKNFEMIKEIPLDRLLLESDSPSMFNKSIFQNEEEYSFYFYEENENGKNYKNHPLSILPLAKKISELREIGYEDFVNQIIKNYRLVIEQL